MTTEFHPPQPLPTTEPATGPIPVVPNPQQRASVVHGDADSLSITITDYKAATAWPELTSMLDELGFSPAVIGRMSDTRALDGTREAQGKNCNVTWTYHPDDGLQMVFEATPVN